jgi:hypothetical protein
LLQSSPPEPVELLKSNKRFTELLRKCHSIVLLVRRYAERMTRLCKTQNTTIAIQAKQIAEQFEVLQERKKVMKQKRVQLEGVAVYTTADVLHIEP